MFLFLANLFLSSTALNTQIAAFLARAADIALAVQADRGKLLKDFVEGLAASADVAALRAEVEAFASAFPMPGFDVDKIGA